ncbi:MAG: DUF4399 domain-containing protein [Bradymonadia bacterium]
MRYLMINVAACLALAAAGCGNKAADTTATNAKKTAEKSAAKPAKKAEEKKARVFFVSPKDGAKVGTELEVEFGLEGMSVAPAGKDINDKTKGHHHLIIDAAPIPYGGMVPMDEKHIHFGKGQTKAKIKLTPGKHTLTMQFADGAHKSYGKALSATITVEAVGPMPKAAPTSAPTSAPTK